MAASQPRSSRGKSSTWRRSASGQTSTPPAWPASTARPAATWDDSCTPTRRSSRNSTDAGPFADGNVQYPWQGFEQGAAQVAGAGETTADEVRCGTASTLSYRHEVGARRDGRGLIDQQVCFKWREVQVAGTCLDDVTALGKPHKAGALGKEVGQHDMLGAGEPLLGAVVMP